MAVTFNKHVHNVIYNATWRCYLTTWHCKDHCKTHCKARNTLSTSGLNAITKALIANHLSHKLYARLVYVMDQCKKHGISLPAGAAEIIATKPKVGQITDEIW